jgi:hypothetical protein
MDSPDPDQRDERTAPAAEADLLGGEARNTGRLDKLTGNGDAEGARVPQRRDADTLGEQQGSADNGEEGSARPGQDENQPGFVKDPDKKFAP